MGDLSTGRSAHGNSIIIQVHNQVLKSAKLSLGELNCLEAYARLSVAEFYEALTKADSKLSERELLLCVLTRLRFIPSEIVTALGISSQGISNMRSRLNRRMFHDKGTRSFNGNIYRL